MGRTFAGNDTKENIIGCGLPLVHDRRILQRTADIHMAFGDRPHRLIGVFFRNDAVGIAGREMLVIENPDLHVTAFTFGQNQIHCFPPAVLAELLMGSRFHAKCLDTGFFNGIDLRNQRIGILAVLPEKRKNVIVSASVQKIGNLGFFHTRTFFLLLLQLLTLYSIFSHFAIENMINTQYFPQIQKHNRHNPAIGPCLFSFFRYLFRDNLTHFIAAGIRQDRCNPVFLDAA